MKVLLFCIALSFTSQIASATVCEGRDLDGLYVSVEIDRSASRMTVEYRCYETGDIWLDCDVYYGHLDSESEINTGTYKSGTWVLTIDPEGKGILFFREQVYSHVDC